ncbi:glycosyltransferase family 2 protein [Klebsiella grimontii]|uniref:glycosyltransferase family 2 protein n=1 Tax=Klebsiella grimontii TaxID=2058152 RepID=UPI00105389A3|nr:glycosyltransferase family 2 protein [Klebsiella grimontii]TCZ61464.1 glycosyltransferase family 2 protein [Klebsiella grimontii]
MKVLAVVVFYNPEGDVHKRCSLISSQVDDLIIYDNSTQPEVIKQNRIITSKISNAKYYGEGSNNGIGAALNFAVSYAQENDYKYLLTFDQDTVIPEEYVSRMLSSFQKAPGAGIIGPIYKDVNANRECRFPVKCGPFTIRKTLSNEKGIQNVMSIITSGTLYPTQIFKEVGCFESDYFIDYIDNEFCLRLLQHGYNVYVDPSIIINHALGNRSLTKLLVKFSPTNYPFYRKYYITRNRFFVYKKYFLKFPSFIAYDFLAFSLDLFRVVMFENDKKRKLKAYLNGFTDFIKNRKGAM